MDVSDLVFTEWHFYVVSCFYLSTFPSWNVPPQDQILALLFPSLLFNKLSNPNPEVHSKQFHRTDCHASSTKLLYYLQLSWREDLALSLNFLFTLACISLWLFLHYSSWIFDCLFYWDYVGLIINNLDALKQLVIFERSLWNHSGIDSTKKGTQKLN